MDLHLWTFLGYMSATGKKHFEDWYDEQDDDVKAKFDAHIEYLGQVERGKWVRPGFDLLSNKQREIGEIRFKVRNIQYRPLGYFGPGKLEYTHLLGCTKKADVYDPKEAKKTVVKRKNEVSSGGRTHAWTRS